MRVKAFGISDIGKVREENQDALSIDEKTGLFIVADGMGGLAEGALAAKYAVQEIADQLKGFLEGGQPGVNIAEAVQTAIETVSSRIRESVGNAAGSTVVLACLDKGKAYVAGLGDSPSYLFRKGSLTRLTRVQNLAELMVETGKITAEEARNHPMRHRLTAYLGMEGKLPSNATQIALRISDRILLCSDGLSGMVEEESIARTLGEEQNTEDAAKKLVAMANEAGGQDNITVLILDIETSRRRTSK